MSVGLVGLPLIVYILLINKFYLLPGGPIAALVTTLCLPAQALAMTLWMDENAAFFLVSELATEVVALNVGLTIVMVVHKPSGLFGAVVVGIFCAVPAWFAFVIPAISMSDVETGTALPFIAMLLVAPTLLWIKNLNQAAKEAMPPAPIEIGGDIPLGRARSKKVYSSIPARDAFGLNVEGIGFILLMLIAPLAMFWLGVGVSKL